MILEWQWFANRDPEPLLRFLGSRTAGGERDGTLNRKFRLFTCGCCRRIAHLAAPPVGEALSLFERALDETIPNASLRAAHEATRKARMAAQRSRGGDYSVACAIGLAGAAGSLSELVASAVSAAKEAEAAVVVAGDPSTAASRVAASAERAHQIALVHDIFGNPYRSVTFDPRWRTDTVLLMAAQMYGSREFSPMPILADALQDAGCDSDDILNHCRDATAIHVRGCWVLDLVLGKE